MPVGYGYDKNTQPLFVDWSEISKSFTDEIKARKEKGEAEKQAILDNRQEFDKLLVDRPSGQNEVANAVITSAVDQIKEYSLLNFERLKNKESSVSQYKNFENNLNSSTALLFDAVENFQTNFGEFATRAQNGTASQIEIFMHEMMQNYTDFGRIAVNVDPRTGSIIIGQLDENGNVTDKTLDVSQLGYFSKYKRDVYDVNAQVKNVANALGAKFIKDSEGRTLKYQGMMYDDLVSNEELMKGLDTEVQSLIDQSFELESVLADSMNYKIVTEKTGNENELYFNQDTNEFEISDTQKKAAFAHVRDKLARAITVERKEPDAEKPKDKSRETLDLINTIRLSGGKVPPELFTQLLKDKGLTDEQIAATFPEGVDDDVFNELSINLEGLLTGLTPELLQSGQADKRKDAIAGETAINKELRRLRSIGISAKYDRKNNQIVINKLGGKDDDAAPIDLEGKTLTQIYDSIINEIPLYQSIEDIFTLLEFQSATSSRREGQLPGDVIFNNIN